MGVANRVLDALRAAGVGLRSPAEIKAEAFDKISRAYSLGTGEAALANRDRCVAEATLARQVRDEAHRTRDEAVADATALRARVAELESYVSELRAAAQMVLDHDPRDPTDDGCRDALVAVLKDWIELK